MKIVLVFAVGVLVGATAMLWLAQNASSTYILQTALQEEQESENEGIDALAKKDYVLAIQSARNEICFIEQESRIRQDSHSGDWVFQYPLFAPVLSQIGNIAAPKDVKLGYANLRLAYALENVGQLQEANTHYLVAKRTLNIESIEKLRKLIGDSVASK